ATTEIYTTTDTLSLHDALPIYPDFATALHLSRQRHARCLDLPIADPPRLERHQPVVAERDGVAARCHPFGAALEPLAKLDPFRREHGSPSDARRIRATVQILGALAFEDPH